MPHFQCKNQADFHIWCITTHQQGFMSMYTTCINVLRLRYAKAHQSIEHMMRVAYMGKCMSMADMDNGDHTW